MNKPTEQSVESMKPEQVKAYDYIAGGYAAGVISAEAALNLLKDAEFTAKQRIQLFEAMVYDRAFKKYSSEAKKNA